MKLLAEFLVLAFSKIFDFFAARAVRSVAVWATVIAASVSLMTAFWIALKLLVAGLVHTTTNKFILMGFYLLWPSNAEACISAYFTAHLTAFIYREHRYQLNAIKMNY